MSTPALGLGPGVLVDTGLPHVSSLSGPDNSFQASVKGRKCSSSGPHSKGPLKPKRMWSTLGLFLFCNRVTKNGTICNRLGGQICCLPSLNFLLSFLPFPSPFPLPCSLPLPLPFLDRASLGSPGCPELNMETRLAKNSATCLPSAGIKGLHCLAQLPFSFLISRNPRNCLRNKGFCKLAS